MLHGTGSRTDDLTQLDVVCEWNGIGRRLHDYRTGNHSDSDTVAAEESDPSLLITIAPFLSSFNKQVHHHYADCAKRDSVGCPLDTNKTGLKE